MNNLQIPSDKWDQLWNGSVESNRQGLFQAKLNDIELQRLVEVKRALECGEIKSSPEYLLELTKAKALYLYRELMTIRRPQLVAKLVENKPDNYYLIQKEDSLQYLLGQLEQESMIVLTTKTTGSEVFGEDYIVGLSMVLPKANQHVYIPVRHRGDAVQLEAEYVFQSLKPFLEDDSLKKVLFDAKFSFHMLRKENIKAAGLMMDVMIAAHLLNENEPDYLLENLVAKYGKYFGFEEIPSTYEDLFGRMAFEDLSLNLAAIYGCRESSILYTYSNFIQKQLNRFPALKNLYENVENPLVSVCVEMEQSGLLIDSTFIHGYKLELQNELTQLKPKLIKAFGYINFDSPDALKKAIYQDLKLEDVSKKKKVDADTLNKISHQHEGIAFLLKYRELSKLLNTYIEPISERLCKDGRLRGSFNQAATVTGRFASSNPNLQNFPENARKMVVPPKGKIIVGVDYSQVEPRFLAHITQDPAFMEVYRTDRDLYSEIASSTFKKPIAECGDGSKWRKMAKTVLLGMLYGISSQSLSEQFDITREEADQIYEDFRTAYPVTNEWFKQANHKANTLGYVETVWGRKRRFEGHVQIASEYEALYQEISKRLRKTKFNVWDEKYLPYALKQKFFALSKEYNRVQRQSINAVIQGSAADGLKISMIKLHEFLKMKGPEWKMIATIHDEMLFEIPASTPISEIEELAAIQRDAFKLSLPIEVDVEVMDRWGNGVPLQEWETHRRLKYTFPY